MLLSLSSNYCFARPTLYRNKTFVEFRSHSDDQILLNSSHRRHHSADLFSLVIPFNQDSASLSSLICSICSLPMTKPTLLPCQHTFCRRCLENNQQIRSGSLPLALNNSLLTNENQPRTISCPKCSQTHQIRSFDDLEENQSMELLINTLLCDHCHELSPSNQLDTCLHCYGVLCRKCYPIHLQNHQTPNLYRIISTDEKSNDEQIFHPRSFDKENQVRSSTPLNTKKPPNSPGEEQPTTPSKKKANQIIRNILASNRRRPSSLKETTEQNSSSTKKTSSLRKCRPAKISLNMKNEENSETDVPPATVPITPLGKFRNLFNQYTNAEQHIKQCRKRQSELDRVVAKLVEILTIKTNENFNRISQFWRFLKQVFLEQMQSKMARNQIVNYLWKTCCAGIDSRKQMENYFEQNDEIQAALEVLQTTLTILNERQSIATIVHLFDREEQATIRTLRRHFESLLSAYCDELALITERIHVYETRFKNWKNTNTSDLDSISQEWTQIVEHDYPALIEKISNDFVTKLPQIEKMLLQMLKNMKQRFLDLDRQAVPRRTSVC